MADGDLRSIFRKKLPHFHHVSVETGSTGRGIPDMEYCYNGQSGWVEFKRTGGWTVDLRPEQVAWLLRRSRAGGRCFVAVRRQTLAGPRKGPPADELWLLRGSAAAELKLGGLKKAPPNAVVGLWENGPAKWDWAAIERALLTTPS